jgi:trafficking protein particle complex subunit 12
MQGRDILENLVDEAGFSSHTLLFNLSAVYELCTERNRQLKLQLAERMAGREPTPRGWEKSNADFKL